MKQLAIPLSNQKTVAKWLVMSSKLDVELTQRSVIRRMGNIRRKALRFSALQVLSMFRYFRFAALALLSRPHSIFRCRLVDRNAGRSLTIKIYPLLHSSPFQQHIVRVNLQ